MGGGDGCDQGAHVGVEPFRIAEPQATLDNLAERLARTRWPGEPDGLGWQDGASPAYLPTRTWT